MLILNNKGLICVYNIKKTCCLETKVHSKWQRILQSKHNFVFNSVDL